MIIERVSIECRKTKTKIITLADQLIEIESLYKNTKLKVAHYIKNSDDPHIELVKSLQKEKEKKKLAVSIQRWQKICRRTRAQ